MSTSAKPVVEVTSPAFLHGDTIPSRYTCDGENINPEINISNIPLNTQSLVLIVDDPDAPGGNFDHWVVWNIIPTDKIKENSQPGKEGQNGTGKTGYTGPCPPSGDHRYFFKVYALDVMLELNGEVKKKDVEEAMKDHVLGKGELMGRYKR